MIEEALHLHPEKIMTRVMPDFTARNTTALSFVSAPVACVALAPDDKRGAWAAAQRRRRAWARAAAQQRQAWAAAGAAAGCSA